MLIACWYEWHDQPPLLLCGLEAAALDSHFVHAASIISCCFAARTTRTTLARLIRFLVATSVSDIPARRSRTSALRSTLRGARPNRRVRSIHDIPENYPLTERLRRACASVQSGEPWYSPEIGEELSSLKYPLYFADFETINPCIPRFAGMAPK
jgi:hypothetical protein